MILSRYAFFVREGELCLAYCSRTNALIKISKTLYDFLSTQKKEQPIDTEIFDEAIVQMLEKHKFIIPAGEDDLFVNELHFKMLQSNFDMQHLGLTIAPTTHCNFSCGYCFEPKKHQATMTDERVAQLMEFIKKHEQSNSVSITWYGGEPLLALPIIEKILRQLPSTNKELSGHNIITNGYYFDDKAIALFKEFPLNRIQITLDGNRERHNGIRFNKNDTSNSFDRIVSNMDRILEELPSTFLSVRVNVGTVNQEHFVEVEQFLKQRWEKYSNFEVYPGLLRIDNTEANNLGPEAIMGSKETSTRFVQHLCDCGTDMYPHLSIKSCAANRVSAFIIGPDGEIYKCWNDVTDAKKIIGYINETKLTNRQQFYDCMLNTSWVFDDKCRQCDVLPICHGGCIWYRLRNLRENGRFDVCVIYRNPDALRSALLARYYTTINN